MAVCKMSLAVTEKYKDRETMFWMPVVAWGTLAELCARYLKKGSDVEFSGKLRQNEYQKDGRTIKAFELTAATMEFCGGGAKSTPPASTEPEADFPF